MRGMAKITYPHVTACHRKGNVFERYSERGDDGIPGEEWKVTAAALCFITVMFRQKRYLLYGIFRNGCFRNGCFATANITLFSGMAVRSVRIYFAKRSFSLSEPLSFFLPNRCLSPFRIVVFLPSEPLSFSLPNHYFSPS